MRWSWRRRPRLVPIAELSQRTAAEEAWELLQEHGIPAVIEADPGMLGGAALTRILVEKPSVEPAQRLIADIVRSDGSLP